jgi:hypothetical protein
MVLPPAAKGLLKEKISTKPSNDSRRTRRARQVRKTPGCSLKPIALGVCSGRDPLEEDKVDESRGDVLRGGAAMPGPSAGHRLTVVGLGSLAASPTPVHAFAVAEAEEAATAEVEVGAGVGESKRVDLQLPIGVTRTSQSLFRFFFIASVVVFDGGESSRRIDRAKVGARELKKTNEEMFSDRSATQLRK